jgi:hypothetical protein
MIRIANDRDLNEKMGLAAYSKMAEQSSWQQYGNRLLARYAIAMRDRENVGKASLPEK